MSELVRYAAACRALAAAVKADEVMSVHTSARALEAVARVAKNLDLEIDAVKLRMRAEARLGAMLREAEEQGLIRPGRPAREPAAAEVSDSARSAEQNGSGAEPLSRVRLREIGVDKKLSSRAQQLAAMGEPAVETMLDKLDRETRARGRLAVDVLREETARRTAQSRRMLAEALSEATALSPNGRRFPVVYADPPWRRKAGIGDRAYENHYTTMSWDEIIGMPVASRVLPDAWLFLWIPRAHLMALHPTAIETPLGRTTVKLPLGWAVAQGWGFDAYSTCAVWTKTDEAHPDDHGTGLIFWDQDELLLLFKRGRGLPMPSGVEKVGSNFRAPAGPHSAKPAYFRDVITRMTGGVPVLELFAREDEQSDTGAALPPHFFTWGNQSRNTAERPDAALPELGAALPPHDPETGEIIETGDTACAS